MAVDTEKVDISFILPTLEELTPESNLQKVINSIYAQPTNYTYEICIYSSTPTVGKNIRWIKEEKRALGPMYGINHICQNESDGEYVSIIVDDSTFVSPFDHVINKLKSNQFADRKFKVCGLSTEIGGVCPLPQDGGRMGSILNMSNSGFPPCITMRFPVVHRDTLNNLLNGYLFHPAFHSKAGDIWLGAYLGLNNEPGLECIESRLKSVPCGYKRNLNWEIADCNTAYALIQNWHLGYKDYVIQENEPMPYDNMTNVKG